jgi:predicted metalloprotease with PDZ domain
MLRRRLATCLSAVTVAGLAGAPLKAQQLEPIRYVLRIPAPQTHYIEIEATYPTSGRPTVDLMMAVWTPGSYLIREFERHVESVRARDTADRALQLEKTRKNRWRVHTGGTRTVRLNYRVYANEHQARTDWVEDSFALINGAATYITLLERARRPHEVSLELPPAWSSSLTALPAIKGAGPHHYRARDFDTLVDSPIVAGNPAVYEFSVDGVPNTLVNFGEAGVWDGARSAGDVERIVRAEKAFWGSLPYERYLFFNFLTDGDDGIEHNASTVLLASRDATGTDSTYADWLELVSHEFFHAWNGKRLRPVELGPFDYETEVYTRSLWIVEGLSDYYSWLLPRRAGLVSRERTLHDISETIESLQNTPGRLVQPLELASYDAWIKQYRPDENSPNVSISYYTKGSIVGLLLDTRIRRLTGGRRSLDDVMRLAFRRFSGTRGYTPAEFRAVASEVAGANLTDFFHHAVETTEGLDYAEMLNWYGLRFTSPDTSARAAAWLGAGTRLEEERLVVSQVLRGTPAYQAGLSAGDELIALDSACVSTGGLDSLLAQHKAGDRVSLVVSRRGDQRTLDITLAAARGRRWNLEVRPDASAEQTARLEAWLGNR